MTARITAEGVCVLAIGALTAVGERHPGDAAEAASALRRVVARWSAEWVPDVMGGCRVPDFTAQGDRVAASLDAGPGLDETIDFAWDGTAWRHGESADTVVEWLVATLFDDAERGTSASAVVPTPDAALALLGRLGAPVRLLTHGRLVLEAAEALLEVLFALRVPVDEALVRAGAVLHDAGKARYPSELDQTGSQHEAAGEAMLLAEGLPANVARLCTTHAAWRHPDCLLEDLVVALADKLWKGVRVAELEQRVIDGVHQRKAAPSWEVWLRCDDAFERIANDGPNRLARSA